MPLPMKKRNHQHGVVNNSKFTFQRHSATSKVAQNQTSFGIVHISEYYRGIGARGRIKYGACIVLTNSRTFARKSIGMIMLVLVWSATLK